MSDELGISSPEQLAAHRELEYLRAVGRAAGPRRRRRRVPRKTWQSMTNRVRQRRRLLDETPKP